MASCIRRWLDCLLPELHVWTNVTAEPNLLEEYEIAADVFLLQFATKQPVSKYWRLLAIALF